MLLIYDQKGRGSRVIRPCPLITINYNPLRNKVGNMGGSYDITLNGTIIAHEGSPYIVEATINNQTPGATPLIASYTQAYNPRPTGQTIALGNRLGAILEKQNAIRELFALDGAKMELCDIEGNDPLIVFYPTVQSISFDEGIYVDTCKYSVSLRAEILFDKNNKIISDGLIANVFEPSGTNANLRGNDGNFFLGDSGRIDFITHMDNVGGFVEDFNDSWSLEENDAGITTDPFAAPYENVVKTYRLTRNISATGRTIYGPNMGGGGATNDTPKRYEAWEQAKSFIQKRLYDPADKANGSHETGSIASYPGILITKLLGSGAIGLDATAGMYGGYNHSRTESIDKTAGSVSITETWLLCSGTAFENYNMSFSSSIDQAIQTVSINGTIKGLSQIPPSGTIYGGTFEYTNNNNPPTGPNRFNTPYENAVFKYQQVTNSGNFGLTSHVYKRAQNVTNITLNPYPVSVSLGVNEFAGEITYDIQFDTRPLLIVPGTISETVTINDTYPGDVFASIPVLGRQTGPVLQYLGTRTEYRRDVSIDLIFAPTATTTTTTAGPGGGSPTTTTATPTPAELRQRFLFDKPTLWNPARTTINNLITALSPAQEVGIRKYFLNPPSESWDQKERRYSLNLSWTYELDH